MLVRWVVLASLFSLVALSPSAAVPIPKKEDRPSPPFKVVWATLGKNHTSKEVRTLGRILKESPVIVYSLWIPASDKSDENDTFFYLIWKSKGIELGIDVEKGVTTAWLYNDCPEGFRRYNGELPSQLTFDDDRDTVEKKLGKPEDVIDLLARDIRGSDQPLEEAWLDYSTKGLEVMRRRPKGVKWTVYSIVARLPREIPKE